MPSLAERPDIYLELQSFPSQCRNCPAVIGRIGVWESFRRTQEEDFAKARWNPIKRVGLTLNSIDSKNNLVNDLHAMAAAAQDCSGPLAGEICGINVAAHVDEFINRELAE